MVPSLHSLTIHAICNVTLRSPLIKTCVEYIFLFLDFVFSHVIFFGQWDVNSVMQVEV